MELLDAELVQKKLEERGLKQNWVIRHMGLRRTQGYQMLRDGFLPKDHEKKNVALEKLSLLLGLQVTQLLVRPAKARRPA
jgi:hypothetical protein